MHRPSSPELGGNYIWLAESLDGIHWGNHKCIAKTRIGKFDSKRLGAGAAPIKTDKGWLEIYHGATEGNRYCLGAILLDLNDPSKGFYEKCKNTDTYKYHLCICITRNRYFCSLIYHEKF